MKILIVRFSSIGDIVLTTPVLRALREQLPDARIHFLTKRQFIPLLDLNPNINRIHTIDSSIDEVLPELKAEKFDRIIDLHNNIRTKVLRAKLGVPMTSFPKLNIRKWLLVNMKWNSMPQVHVVNRYFKAAASLGIEDKNYPIEFYIREENNVDVLSRFGLEPGTYYAIAIGAQFATKRMPADLIVTIVNTLNKPVIIIGGPEDQEEAAKIVNSTTRDQIYSACGDFNIGQSASIVRQSYKLLTNDTGMMHIAAAFDLKIVSVWGNTVPAFGMYPYKPGNEKSYSIHEVKGLNCRPCSKIGYAKCPKGHFKCMKIQDAEAISQDLMS